MQIGRFYRLYTIIIENAVTQYLLENMRYTDEELAACQLRNENHDDSVFEDCVGDAYEEWLDKIYNDIFYNEEIKAIYKTPDNNTFPLQNNSCGAQFIIYGWHLKNNREEMIYRWHLENNREEIGDNYNMETFRAIFPIEYLDYILDGIFGNTPDLMK